MIRSLLLLIIAGSCSNKTDVLYGTKFLKTYTFNIGDEQNRQQSNQLPDTKLLYYDRYIVELAFGINFNTVDDKTTMTYGDTTYFFIDTITEKCDQYKDFSISAVKQASMEWKDKPTGMGYPKIKSSKDKEEAYTINAQTVFIDTIINNKSFKYTIFHESPDVKNVIYFSQDKNDLPFSLTTFFGEKYGAVLRTDGSDNKRGIGMSSEVEVFPNNLTEKEIAVIKQWIKNQQSD